MKIIATHYASLISILVVISLASTSIVRPQGQSEKEQRRQLARQNAPQAKQIEQSVDTGIFVDTPQVYDDSSLQMMLNAARARLAAIQSLDQTGLLSRIGAVTGASLQQQAINAQVLGPPLPTSAVTSLGATGSTTTVNNASGQTTTNVAGLPAQNVVTTTPQMTAAAPSLPQNSAALPTNFSVSSLDALNEMMQLTYEIANLQLLLEGSLSGRFVKGQRIIKPRTTLGFPITVTSQEAYKDAVAVVEVEAINPPTGTLSNEPPAVTALLPREKTYNVAAITDRMTSIGGGLVTQVINGGFSFLRGRKSYYIVQDQDTLALMQRSPTPNTSAVFSWQFRPVLGQSYVRSGLKQTFVQLASPIPRTAGCFGKVKIRTYWRKYDRKHGVLKNVIPESIRTYDLQPVPVYDLTPVIESLDVKDLGSGQVLASIGGRFLSGTYIRVGSNYYREGSPGFTSELTQLRFVAPAADIAKNRAYLVSRDGTETEIVDPRDPEIRPLLQQDCNNAPAQPTALAAPSPSPQLSITVAAYDNSNSILTATLTKMPAEPEVDDYLIIVGGRVFGLSDAPIERTSVPGGGAVLRAVLPTNLLLGATKIEVKPLFWKENHGARLTKGLFRAESSSDKIVLISQAAAGNTFLLYGNRLSNASILLPQGVTWIPSFMGITQDAETMRIFTLTADQLKSFKQIVLQKEPGGRPTVLSLPAPPSADSKPVLTVKGRITVGTDETTVQGDNLDKLKAVRFKGKELKFTLSKDKKSVTLAGLISAGVTAAPVEQELEFEFEDEKKASLKLDVVNSIIETIERK